MLRLSSDYELKEGDKVGYVRNCNGVSEDKDTGTIMGFEIVRRAIVVWEDGEKGVYDLKELVLVEQVPEKDTFIFKPEALEAICKIVEEEQGK